VGRVGSRSFGRNLEGCRKSFWNGESVNAVSVFCLSLQEPRRAIEVMELDVGAYTLQSSAYTKVDGNCAENLLKDLFY